MISTTRLFLVLFLAIFSLRNILALKEGECEVCIDVLEKFRKGISDDVAKDPKKIETEFRKYCKTSKTKENRFVSINKITNFSQFLDDVFLHSKIVRGSLY